MNRVSLSESHINLPPLRRLLAYQKRSERIIYETRLAGVRLRSVDAGDTCISQCNSLGAETDYPQRAEMWRSLDSRLQEWKLAGQSRLLKMRLLVGANKFKFVVVFFFNIPVDTCQM